MRISHEKLIAQAEATGFRADVLEKVAHLLELLNGLSRHPFLKGKLALKGGTTLNLFVFNVPRLCRQFLSAVFPFTKAEREFLDLLLDRGVIDSSLLTSDPILQQSINDQPLLRWKAVNVRKHKGL